MTTLYTIYGPSLESQFKGDFSYSFLVNPSKDWTVDWTAGKPSGSEYLMAGVLVKHLTTRRVWRLTGETFHANGELMYKATWPD